MRITAKHMANSQIHSIPLDSEHTESLRCKCRPDITIDNGHLIVDHKEKSTRTKWRVAVKNFGTKLLGTEGGSK